MKREDLKAMGLTDEQIDKIMAENGKDIQAQKTAAETAQADAATLKTQVEDANKQIKAFTDMKPDELKKAAADWEAKAKQAEADGKAQVAKMKFDRALEDALAAANAKNPKTVLPLLSIENLKLNETDNSVIGLEDQLKKIKEDTKNSYLFGEDPKTPQVVAGGNTSSAASNPIMEAAMKAAGLKPPTK